MKKSPSYGQKKEQVLSTLRERIRCGTYAPEARLPTVDELVAEFDYSRTTMQQAIEQLRSEGFIETVNRKGLFVCARPPHLYRIGVVFPCAREDASWTKFFEVFLHELPLVHLPGRAYEFETFFLGESEAGQADGGRLLEHIHSRTLAGLILHRGVVRQLGAGFDFNGSPAVLINEAPYEANGLPVVKTDSIMFLDKAMEWFKSRKRSRVASITMVGIPQIEPGVAEKHGLQTRPHWFCATGANGVENTGNLVRLLLDYPATERPDALLIANDHLTDSAVNAIRAAGLHCGKDIDVVAHCNWPRLRNVAYPISRLGFHSHNYIRTSVDLIERITRGETVPESSRVPALFETEVAETNDPDSVNGGQLPTNRTPDDAEAFLM